MASLRSLLYPESEISLLTLLSPDEARARLLAAASDRGGGWYLKRRRAGQRFIGGQQGDRLVLERLVPYPDPWRPTLDITLLPKGSGTELRASLRLTRGGRILTTIWHTAALIIGLGALGAVIVGLILPRGLILPVLAAVYAALPALDQRVERKATLEVLDDVLNSGEKTAV